MLAALKFRVTLIEVGSHSCVSKKNSVASTLLVEGGSTFLIKNKTSCHVC